jgi:60 kDa SS-A/Ro ribonucleoprotein
MHRNWVKSIEDYSIIYGECTGMEKEWQAFKTRNKQAKLVCLDIQPYTDTQCPDNKDVLNIGGFNDSVFSVVDRFVNTDVDSHFTDVINEMELAS